MRLELTKRGDYALRAVLALARATHEERRSVRDVAIEHGIPIRFLAQIMTALSQAGLVEAALGRRGGYRLAKPAAAISLLEVVEAVEGDSRRRSCVLRGGPCAIIGVCDVHEAFAAAQEDVLHHLGETSVADAIRR